MERPAEQFLEPHRVTDRVTDRIADIHKVIAPAKASVTMQAITTQATVQRVHCPTCGSHAERVSHQGTIRTQCAQCDYLMTICAETGRVIEAYAPSFTPAAMSLMAS